MQTSIMGQVVLDMFSADEIALIEQLDYAAIPRHVAIIMDGNGRWATRQSLPRVVGHHAGVESVRVTLKACRSLGISYLTLYSFSTENWGRPDAEVTALMGLIEEQLRTETAEMHTQGVRVRQIGRLEGLPASMQQALSESIELTKDNTDVTLTLAINYSGRTELVDAARKLAAAAAAGTLDPAAIDEDTITGALYDPTLPDPELLVRTAGEMRVSNYLLWQIAYTEYWSTPALWPEFRPVHLLQALMEYQHRKRKFGKVVP